MSNPTKFGSNWCSGFKEDKQKRQHLGLLFLLCISDQQKYIYKLFRGPPNEHSYQVKVYE